MYFFLFYYIYFFLLFYVIILYMFNKLNKNHWMKLFLFMAAMGINFSVDSIKHLRRTMILNKHMPKMENLRNMVEIESTKENPSMERLENYKTEMESLLNVLLNELTAENPTKKRSNSMIIEPLNELNIEQAFYKEQLNLIKNFYDEKKELMVMIQEIYKSCYINMKNIQEDIDVMYETFFYDIIHHCITFALEFCDKYLTNNEEDDIENKKLEIQIKIREDLKKIPKNEGLLEIQCNLYDNLTTIEQFKCVSELFHKLFVNKEIEKTVNSIKNNFKIQFLTKTVEILSHEYQLFQLAQIQ